MSIVDMKLYTMRMSASAEVERYPWGSPQLIKSHKC